MEKHSLRKDQSGLVSFMVVIIIMLVLSLIVLAFAQLVRREQRQTLDRQLNTQAFYAAESGINDARVQLRNNAALSNQEYDQCDEFIAAAGLGTASRLDGPTGVISYSCLLVDPTPPQLEYSSVPTDQSVALPVQSTAPISSLQISWEDSSGGTNVSGCPAVGAFPGRWNTGGTCQIGMLRLELVPFAGGRTRDQLITDRFITFLQPRPSGGTGTIAYATAAGVGAPGQGANFGVTCNGVGGPRRCTINIDLRAVRCGNILDQNCWWQAGYMRMRSIYRGLGITVTAFNGANNTGLTGVQASIDATGKANDVLKRIKVSVPLGPTDGEPSPEYALQSTRSQCKRFSVVPTPSPIITPIFPGASTSDNVCNPTSQITDPPLP